MLYRLFTENKNRQWIEEQVIFSLGCATIYPTFVVWKGGQELSLCIEYDDLNDADEFKRLDLEKELKLLCENIRLHNEQETVLVQKLQCQSSLW